MDMVKLLYKRVERIRFKVIAREITGVCRKFFYL